MNQKNYPNLYNQNNYGATDLGNSTVDTIQSGGCFDCCCAMKACFYGHQVDPVQMNKLFVDNGVYISLNADGSNKDLLPDNGVSKVFPDIVYLQTINYEPIATDLQAIKSVLDDPAKTITLRINFGNGNYHFVEAIACDGTTLHIANPLSGAIEDFSKRYGNPVTANLHVLVFTGPLPQVQQTPDLSQNTPLAIRFSQAISMATNFKTVAAHFHMSPDDQVSPNGGQLLVDKIVGLEEDNIRLQDHINALEKVPSISTPPVTVTTTVSATPQVTVAPPPAQQEMSQSPTFANGSAALPSNPQTTVVKPISRTKQTMLSGPVTLKEFIRGIFNVLFL